MKPGIFQRAAEFDRCDGEMRRAYLAVDADGRLVIANLREQRAITVSDIASALHRCTSTGPWSPGTDLRFEPAHGAPAFSLRCEVGDDHVDVIDRAQDEWGGFGGRYERLPAH